MARPASIDREAVRRLWAERLTDHEAAVRLGCRHETIYRIRRQLGLAYLPKRAAKPAMRGWCVGCHEDASRDSVAGLTCDRCGRWVDEQQERIAWLLP